ncbi:hypothetical protein DFH07DRAFT_942957, partial [Mycena maculata]
MLPQELVNTIVGIIDCTDIDTLKSCALACSSLCSATQPILFRSLTLRGGIPPDPANYAAVTTLLTESPHIGAYITDLILQLPSEATYLAGAEDLPKILAKLARVRRCIIKGGEGCTWYKLGPALCSALLDFVSRQPLDSLRVRSVTCPQLAFRHLVDSAPDLSFKWVDVSITNTHWAPARPASPMITSLALDQGTETISHLLSRPDYAPYVASLRRVSLRDGLGMPLVNATARTLEHIRLGRPVSTHSDPLPPLPPLPILPSLRAFEIEVDFDASTAPWVSDTIVDVLRSKTRRPGAGWRPLEQLIF